MNGIGEGKAEDPGTVVVAESRLQTGILFGFLIAAFGAALARGTSAAQTPAGRLAAVLIFGAVVVFFAARWIAMIRRPCRLEISEDTITYLRRDGRATSLSRQSGDELRFVARNRGGRISTLGLTIAGTDTVITLGIFSRRAVRQACRSRGWRFSD